MHCNDTTYVDLFLNNKIRCPALGVIVDIAVVETQKSRNPEMNYSGKKILFDYARILCLVVLGGSCGLELGLGEPTTTTNENVTSNNVCFCNQIVYTTPKIAVSNN